MLLFLHLGAVVLLLPLALPLSLKIAVAVLIALSLVLGLLRHGLRRTVLAVQALKQDSDGVWSVQFSSGEIWRVGDITSRFVHRWLVLLSLRVDGRRLPVALALAADAVEPETFRRLRAALLAPRQNPAA